MSLMDSFQISASGMSAQRTRMDIISQNIANVDTTRDANGEVYRRQTVAFAEKRDTTFERMLRSMQTGISTGSSPVHNGVKITAIVEDHVTAMKSVYDPSHPDADEDGYVLYPNVDTVTEMTNLIDATRSFEANVTAFNATKNMALKGLEIGK